MSKITQLNEKAWAATVGNNHYDFRFEQSKWVDTGKWILVYKSPFIWTNYGKESWDWEIAFEEKPVILGRPEELTGGEMLGLVEKGNDGSSGFSCWWYKDYETGEGTKDFRASFRSLLKSKGLKPETALILIKQ